MKILICANSYWNFYNFRKDFIINLKKQGHDIILLAPKDNIYKDIFIKNDISCSFMPFANKKKGIISNLITLFFLYFYIKKNKPKVLITYTMKVNILLSLSSFFFKIKIINNISGLGSSLINSYYLKIIVIFLLKISLKKSFLVFFQNFDDQDFFIKNKIIPIEKTRVLKFFGININNYKYSSFIKRPANETRFLYVGRMIKDKGIYELINAIKIVKKKYPKVIFNFLGKVDDNNPGFIDIRKLKIWNAEGLINYLNFNNDVKEIISQSDCVILPSYREGLPKSLIESLSIGRPAIAANVPGCKDLVTENFNGYLFQSKNVNSLVEKIILFINLSYEKKNEMSINSRSFIVKNFNSDNIIKQYIKHLDLR